MLHSLKKKYAPYWQLYIFLLLPVAYIIIFAYVPMAGVQLAFKKLNFSLGIWGSPWVGMANFTKLFSTPVFVKIVRNTLVLSFYSIFAGFPIPIVFALCLNTVMHMRFKKIVQTITYMPHFISIVVLVGMLMQVFHSRVGLYGVFYQMLTGTMPKDIFSKPVAFQHLYVWSGIWQGFGWGSIIYLAALSAVDPDLHEAAQIDGALRYHRVIHIDIPTILPTMSIMLVLRMGRVMSIGMEKVYLMQNDLNLSVSEVISTYVYKQSLGATHSPDYAYSTAVGLFNSVINLITIFTVNLVTKRLGGTSLF